MSDWMSDAKNRIEAQRRQEEAERLRLQQLAEQQRQVQQSREEVNYQELEKLLEKLRVRNKLNQIAQRYIKVGRETIPGGYLSYTRGVNIERSKPSDEYCVSMYAFRKTEGEEHGRHLVGGEWRGQRNQPGHLVGGRMEPYERTIDKLDAFVSVFLCTNVSWKEGKELRISVVGPGYIDYPHLNYVEGFNFNKDELSVAEARLDEFLAKACERSEQFLYPK